MTDNARRIRELLRIASHPLTATQLTDITAITQNEVAAALNELGSAVERIYSGHAVETFHLVAGEALPGPPPPPPPPPDK